MGKAVPSTRTAFFYFWYLCNREWEDEERTRIDN